MSNDKNRAVSPRRMKTECWRDLLYKLSLHTMQVGLSLAHC